MKKFLSLLLAAMMLLSCASAAAEDAAEWKINKTTQLVARKSAAAKVDHIVVPAEVDGLSVRGLEYMCFNMYKNFAKLTLSEGLVMLDRSTTRDLPNLAEVELPDSLLVIREGNFTNLPKLTSVVIPASVRLVQSSFNKCTSLTSITFEGTCPVLVEEGAYGLFTDLPADCVIYVPDDQVDVYKAALADREDAAARIQPSGQKAVRISWMADESEFQFDASTGTITGYTGTASYLKIPATIGGVAVKHIADEVFSTSYSLCCVVIPEGVETIGEYGFAGIKLLSYLSLPSTLTSVGDSAFSSARLSAIAFNGTAVPGYNADAFQRIDGDWRMILPYGSAQEYADAFAAYLAETAPQCVVAVSMIEPYTFPALDAEAGAPFVGTWNAVAVTDGTDFYGMDMLGISITANLHADGTGLVDLDSDATPGGWYVEDGTAVFAPIMEEGGQPEPSEAIPFVLDENSRLTLDLGGLIVLMELEGTIYETPAIPEKPWPELDQDNAKNFIGVWEAVSYVADGETVDASLAGSMLLTLNDDGTASMTEGDEEPYALQWYADYGTAYVGPAMSALAQITFDGNGNIKMEQDGATVIMAPYVEARVIEGADELLGEWLDDIGNRLVLKNDGSMTYTYVSDGWVDEYAWDVVDGAAIVTEGHWANCPITLENGILTITNGEGIFQIFSVDGDLSAYYGGEEEYNLPEAQPIGPEGEPYFGTWTMDMGGMTMKLILNQDGTCAMEMMGEAEPGVWTMENGKAYVMGDEITIDGDGNLVMEAAGMVFVRGEGAADAGEEMSEEEQLLALMAALAEMEEQENAESGDPYIGVKFEATGAIVQGMALTAEQLGCAGDYVIFNADGSAELVMGGIDVQTLGWKRGTVNVLGTEYEDGFSIDYYGTYYNFAITEEGLLLDYFGMLRTYKKAEGETVSSAAAPAADPYVDQKFLCTGSIVQGMKLSAEQLGCAGDYVIFNADGSVELVMSGIDVQTLGWKRGTVNVAGVEYEGFAVDYYGTIYNFATTEEGLLLDYFGMVRTYEAE